MTIIHRITAKAIIVHGGAILLCNQAGEPIWHLPGGGLDGDETPTQALLRELREEVGLPLAWASHVTELDATWQPFGNLRDTVHEHLHLFMGQLQRMTPEGITKHEPGLNRRWFPLAHIMPCQGPQFIVAPKEILPWIVQVGGQCVS